MVRESPPQVRVLLLGPPFSGKNTLIEAVARRHGRPVSRFEHYDGKYRNVGGYVSVDCLDKNIRIATLSGAVTSRDVWLHYASAATLLVLVLDSQDSRAVMNLETLGILSLVKVRSDILVIWTKTDLTHSEALAPEIEKRLRISHEGAWSLVKCSSIDDHGPEALWAWIVERCEHDQF